MLKKKCEKRIQKVKESAIRNMNDSFYLAFGYAASANACIMMFPQVYLTCKKRSVEDLSMKTICLNVLTQFLFLPYSIHFRLYPLITVNAFLTMCDIAIIVLYLYNIQKGDLHEKLLPDEV